MSTRITWTLDRRILLNDRTLIDCPSPDRPWDVVPTNTPVERSSFGRDRRRQLSDLSGHATDSEVDDDHHLRRLGKGHHDIELMSDGGNVLARSRVPENVNGLKELLKKVNKHCTEGDEVTVGIERDNGPWVTALRRYGFLVYAINPVQSARCRTRFSLAGAKSDVGDAHVLAEMVRTDRTQLRSVAENSVEVEGLKILTQTHKSLTGNTIGI